MDNGEAVFGNRTGYTGIPQRFTAENQRRNIEHRLRRWPNSFGSKNVDAGVMDENVAAASSFQVSNHLEKLSEGRVRRERDIIDRYPYRTSLNRLDLRIVQCGLPTFLPKRRGSAINRDRIAGRVQTDMRHPDTFPTNHRCVQDKQVKTGDQNRHSDQGSPKRPHPAMPIIL